MLRSAFQGLFWSVLLARKQQSKFTLKALADKLGINKSYVSRSFSSPPNWQIDKISDMADALGVDMIIAARDQATGRYFTLRGPLDASVASTDMIDGGLSIIGGPDTDPTEPVAVPA